MAQQCAHEAARSARDVRRGRASRRVDKRWHSKCISRDFHLSRSTTYLLATMRRSAMRACCLALLLACVSAQSPLPLPANPDRDCSREAVHQATSKDLSCGRAVWASSGLSPSTLKTCRPVCSPEGTGSLRLWKVERLQVRLAVSLWLTTLAPTRHGHPETASACQVSPRNTSWQTSRSTTTRLNLLVSADCCRAARTFGSLSAAC